jgi:hypothetical protein
MKLTLQVLGIFLVISGLAIVNVVMNTWKHHDCIAQGGRYIENISDSTLSMCMLGK